MSFKNVQCPRCKVMHEMYFHEHKDFNDTRCMKCSIIDYKKGDKVRYVVTNTIHTVLKLNDNLCGDGCCQGYLLEGIDGYVWKTDVEGIFK